MITTTSSGISDIEAQLNSLTYAPDIARQYGLPSMPEPAQPTMANQGPIEQPVQPTVTPTEQLEKPQQSEEQPKQELPKEKIPKVLHERNVLRTENMELKSQLEELQARLSEKEGQDNLSPEESREYIQETARIEALKIRKADMEVKESESFYTQFPEAIEHQKQIEELIAQAPNINREVFYRALNPTAFVEEAIINQSQPNKYASPLGSTPADLGQPKSIDQLSGDDLKNELNRAFMSLRG